MLRSAQVGLDLGPPLVAQLIHAPSIGRMLSMASFLPSHAKGSIGEAMIYKIFYVEILASPDLWVCPAPLF